MLTRRISRRNFLRLMTIGTIGAIAFETDRRLQPVGLGRMARWMAGGKLNSLRPPAQVAVTRCTSYDDDLQACIRDLWESAAMPDVRGKRVLIKPNLVDFDSEHPIATHPAIVAAVIDVVQALGVSELVVGDGSAFHREAAPLLQMSGLAKVLSDRNVRFVDLNYDDPKPVQANKLWFLDQRNIWLARHALEADIIVSLPKLKTHHWAGVSLSMKNLFGVAPGCYYGWPKNMLHHNGIPLSINGIYAALPKVVALVDGITGMEGDGPLFGEPVSHGVLIAGADPLAVDISASQLMGYQIEEVPHLWLAQTAGVGQSEKIEIVGPPITDLVHSYEKPPSL